MYFSHSNKVPTSFLAVTEVRIDSRRRTLILTASTENYRLQEISVLSEPL